MCAVPGSAFTFMGSGLDVSSPAARVREPEAVDRDKLDARGEDAVEREEEAEEEREAEARSLGGALGTYLVEVEAAVRTPATPIRSPRRRCAP